jgi:hypothetical protein
VSIFQTAFTVNLFLMDIIHLGIFKSLRKEFGKMYLLLMDIISCYELLSRLCSDLEKYILIFDGHNSHGNF